MHNRGGGEQFAHHGSEREQIDDAKPGRGHGVDLPGDVGELGQLGHEDKDGQGVDEAGHHGAGYESHQAAEPEVARRYLEEAGEQGGRQQILQAMFPDQGHHQERHGAGGGGNHAGTTADEGDDHGDAEGGIEADLGVDARNDGEGDGLRDQRQGDDDARQQIAPYVGEPLLSCTFQHGDFLAR